jgi:hypothetical protein
MTGENQQVALADALKQLTYALELLDAASAPAQIGAHVDLAIQQLYTIVTQPSDANVRAIESNVIH